MSIESEAAVFNIRHATEQDVDFILAAFDSTLPYLESIGAGAMWGSSKSPFSSRDGFTEDIVESVQRSLVKDAAVMVLIAERGDRNVGVARVTHALPQHLYEQKELKGKLANISEEVLYLEVLVSDYRVEERIRKGCGEALVRGLADRGREMGKKSLWVDCWTGNGDDLVRYYARPGFEQVGTFQIERKKTGGTWPGTLLMMDLAQ